MADHLQEIIQLANKWADGNDQLLRKSLREQGIGITDELFDSVRSRVYELAGAQVGIDLSFLMRGRYRDMGAGRGSKIESIRSNGDIIRQKTKAKGRRAAKWYSRTFYSRLNKLNGAVSASLAEQAILTIIQPLKKLT